VCWFKIQTGNGRLPCMDYIQLKALTNLTYLNLITYVYTIYKMHNVSSFDKS